MVAMAMEVQENQKNTKVNEKIGQVLQKFLEPNTTFKNNANLNLFLKRLFGPDESGKNIPKPINLNLNDQLCMWIVKATKLWEYGNIKPPTTILSFALNLTSHLSSNELIFVDLNSKNIYESLVGVAQINSSKDPNVIYGIVSVLCSFLEHKSGVQWVMATTYWTDAINFGITVPTAYLRNKAYEFLTKLLEKTICFNRNFSVNVVGILLKPLRDVLQGLLLHGDKVLMQVQIPVLFESMKPTLEMVTEVAIALLKTFNAKALKLFLEQGTSQMIEQLLPLSNSEDFSFNLLKVQFVFLMFKVQVKIEGEKTVEHDSAALSDIYVMFELIRNEMEKNNVRSVLKICDHAHRLWQMAPRLPPCIRGGQVIEFQNQMVLFQIMPVLIFSIQMLGGQDTHVDTLFIDDDYRKDFIRRLLRLAVSRSLELCYKWKEHLEKKTDLMEDVTFSLQNLEKSKNLLNKEQAATMFPAFMYALGDTLTILKTMTNVEWTPRCSEFLITLVETVVDLVETFDLTWKDTIETIRVMELACNFLLYPEWPDKKIVIKGLKLLNTAISKYMCPDMVLLLHSTKDSTIFKAGNLLHTKCYDSCWEIRDSALEVVYTLASNANSKFPALENVILDEELPELIVKMAVNDVEYTVRTTAIRCLQEFVQMPDICDVVLREDTFLDNILNILENEPEAIVRKEAAILVFEIYKRQNFPDRLLLRLYDVMTHAAIGDLNWEVRFNALDFWYETWKTHLNRQGMIDSTFPSHTFSPELKKIVALTELEVRKRIIKVLNQLSNCGCLHVTKYMVYDSNPEISKKVAHFNNRVVELFKKYKIPSENVDLSDSSSFRTVQSNSRCPQIFEPMSSASSTTLTAPNPDDIENLDEFETHYFDSHNTFPPPFTPIQTNDQVMPAVSSALQTLNSVYTPSPSNHASYDGAINQEEIHIKTTPNWGQENYGSTTGTQNMSSINRIDDTFDIDMLNVVNSSSIDDMTRQDKLDEFLGGIYTNQINSNSNRMKSKTYLAPSQYLQFVHKEVEPYVGKKAQRETDLDEMDSLLDDILSEYSPTDFSSIIL